MQYQAIVRREGAATLAEFPDCPGCQTFVEGNEDLTATATEALEGWLEAELQAGRVPPSPNALVRPSRGTQMLSVRINPQLAAKVQLRQARYARGWTQGQLAEQLGITQQAIAKLEDPDRGIEVASLARLAEVLGFDLTLLMTEREPLSRRSAQGSAIKRTVPVARANKSDVVIHRRDDRIRHRDSRNDPHLSKTRNSRPR